MLNQSPAAAAEIPTQPTAQSLLQPLTQLCWQDSTPKRIRGGLRVAIGYGSNLIGIVMMQFGAIDVLDKACNFKQDLGTGSVTSTVYTLAVLALVQFKVLDLAALLPDFGAIFSTVK